MRTLSLCSTRPAHRCRDTKQHAHGAQRGFVGGRNLQADVFEVDTEARLQPMKGNVRALLVLVCFGFVVAFTCVAHAPLFRRAMVDVPGCPCFGLITPLCD